MAELLIVDDDADVSTPLLELLKLEGYAVRLARNGAEGLVAISEHFPDLILLDIEMPQLSGPGLAYEMLLADAGREKIPIILLSGATELRLIAKIVGTPYQMGKPFNFDHLTALISKALQERRAIQPDLGLLAAIQAA